MHGLQTIKYLNEQKTAEAIMAKHQKVDLSEKQAKDFAQALAQKATAK